MKSFSKSISEIDFGQDDGGWDMPLTIKDVAERAGVSASTVSRVLTSSAPVQDATKRAVEDAIRELGYRPNGLARSLRNKETKTIGLIIPDVANPFFPEVAKGVEDAACRRGYSVILCNSGNDRAKEAMYFRVLQERRIDGMIITGSGSLDQYAHLRSRDSSPVVFLDRNAEGLEVDSVEADSYGGAAQAVRHLLELGHRQIAFVSGSSVSTGSRRRSGYIDTLTAHGIVPPPEYIIPGDFTLEAGRRAGLQLLGLNPRPTAVFVSSDIAAIGVMMAAESLSLSIPGDLSVAGFDNTLLALVSRPALTTVSQPKYEMGGQAVKLLLERLQKKRQKVKHLLLPTRLEVRGSTAAVFTGGTVS